MNTGCSYLRRHNSDGTIDSICLHCFLTAGSANAIEDLTGIEAQHRCDKDHLSAENQSGSGLESIKLVLRARPACQPDESRDGLGSDMESGGAMFDTRLIKS